MNQKIESYSQKLKQSEETFVSSFIFLFYPVWINKSQELKIKLVSLGTRRKLWEMEKLKIERYKKKKSKSCNSVSWGTRSGSAARLAADLITKTRAGFN